VLESKSLAAPSPSDRINYWTNKLLTHNKKNVTIAFAVTDVSYTHKTEDYRRAEKLRIEFIKLGWEVVFLNRLKCQWYELDPKIDVLMTFSDLYDLEKIETLNTHLIKIAWASKWYEQWRGSPYLDQYLFIIVFNEESTAEPQKVYDNDLFHLPTTPDIKNKNYRKIAQQIKEELLNRLTKLTISLKIPARSWKGIKNWGDYHFALLLKQQLDLKGFFVYLHVQSEWYGTSSVNCDVNFVLRGLRKHIVDERQINIMWNISHPNSILMDEYEDYDHVFIASTYWAKEISKTSNVTVEPLLQCTDTLRFHIPTTTEKHENHHELLFVGNSRGIFRPILKDLLPTDYDLAIFGEHPIDEIPKKHLIGTYLPNDELYKHYGSADVLLNDHWDDMKAKGFISNRIYDGIASGAFIISDKVKFMGDLEDYIITYEHPSELKQSINYYLNHPEKRKELIKKGHDYIEKKHTFKERAETIYQTIHQIFNQKEY